MQVLNEASRLKRQILIRIIKAFNEGNLIETADNIPVEMRPRGSEASRCCIYRDRAVIKYRIIAALGIGIEDETDEALPLSHYAEKALRRETLDKDILSVLDVACSGCIRSQYLVTNACRGCLARPCRMNCPRNAVSFKNGQATIDHDKCVNCGKCMEVCPYHAITRVPIPCEEACPVVAIKRNEEGTQFIDFDKCVSCGKCMGACPFGAVIERSQIIDVLKVIKSGKKVVAMAAPSIIGQFPGSLEQIAEAINLLGFERMEEVASGAETTAKNETEEFVERINRGDHIMTTSCCPAYVETVKRHVPELGKFVSDTLSPMKYTAAAVKKADPDAVTVFIGPCVAKRKEAQSDINTDYIITFEELGAMMVAEEIEVASLKGINLGCEAGAYARGFATSCGVSSAILNEKRKAAEAAGSDNIPEIKSAFINGLDRKTVRQLKLYAEGKIPANFLEVMACEGGCIGGPCAIGQVKLAAKAVEKLVAASNPGL